MKHCHCGLEHHFEHFRVKKLGILGVTLMVLHILFHVVECLILPSILVAFSGHLAEESAQATDTPSIVVSENPDLPQQARQNFCFNGQPTFTSVYWQSFGGSPIITSIQQTCK